MLKVIRQTIKNGNINNAFVNSSPVKIITTNKGNIDMKKLTVDERTLLTGYIYLGTYTFVISEALYTIDPNA